MAKQCVQCGTPIRDEAKKCPSCGAHQVWIWRQLNVSSLVLSLLISLFAVLGIVLPQIYKLFDKTRITIRQSQSSPSEAAFEVTKYVYWESGATITRILKEHYPPDDFEAAVSSYQDAGVSIAYIEEDETTISIDNPPTRFIIEPDRRYQLIITENIFQIEFKYVARNIGKKYGVIHYLEIDRSNMETLLKVVERRGGLEADLILTKSESSIKDYRDDRMSNLVANPDFFKVDNKVFADTITRIQLWTDCQPQLLEDTLFRTQIGRRLAMQSLVFNHDDTETPLTVPIDISGTIRYRSQGPRACRQEN